MAQFMVEVFAALAGAPWNWSRF